MSDIHYWMLYDIHKGSDNEYVNTNESLVSLKKMNV